MPHQQSDEWTTELRPGDVLFGRGSGPNDHEGNIRFRDLVNERKEEYMSTNHRQTKAAIAQEVVEEIYKRKGRFLKRAEEEDMKRLDIPEDLDCEVYCMVDEESIMEKAKQALRQNRTAATKQPAKTPSRKAPLKSDSSTSKKGKGKATIIRRGCSSNKRTAAGEPPRHRLMAARDSPTDRSPSASPEAEDIPEDVKPPAERNQTSMDTTPDDAKLPSDRSRPWREASPEDAKLPTDRSRPWTEATPEDAKLPADRSQSLSDESFTPLDPSTAPVLTGGVAYSSPQQYGGNMAAGYGRYATSTSHAYSRASPDSGWVGSAMMRSGELYPGFEAASAAASLYPNSGTAYPNTSTFFEETISDLEERSRRRMAYEQQFMPPPPPPAAGYVPSQHRNSLGGVTDLAQHFNQMTTSREQQFYGSGDLSMTTFGPYSDNMEPYPPDGRAPSLSSSQAAYFRSAMDDSASSMATLASATTREPYAYGADSSLSSSQAAIFMSAMEDSSSASLLSGMRSQGSSTGYGSSVQLSASPHTAYLHDSNPMVGRRGMASGRPKPINTSARGSSEASLTVEHIREEWERGQHTRGVSKVLEVDEEGSSGELGPRRVSQIAGTSDNYSSIGTSSMDILKAIGGADSSNSNALLGASGSASGASGSGSGGSAMSIVKSVGLGSIMGSSSGTDSGMISGGSGIHTLESSGSVKS